MRVMYLRRPQLGNGLGNTQTYVHIKEGLWTPPVRLGKRASGWPEHEAHALNAARLAGASDDEIRALVKQLIAKRKNAAGDRT